MKSRRGAEFAAVLVAAGAGRRFGKPKAFLALAGKPLAWWPLRAFAGCREARRIVLVVAPGEQKRGEALLRRAGIPVSRGVVAEGGATRHESVRFGIAALGAWKGIVAVHDAARPLVRPGQINDVVHAASKYGAAALARRVVDTLAVSKKGLLVEGYADRGSLYALETPQAFRAAWWARALEKIPHPEKFTDETSLLRAAGFPVRLVLHDGFNIKVTTRGDLALVTAWIRMKRT